MNDVVALVTFVVSTSGAHGKKEEEVHVEFDKANLDKIIDALSEAEIAMGLDVDKVEAYRNDKAKGKQ